VISVGTADALIGAAVRVRRFRCNGTVAAERHGGHELSVRLDPPLGLLVWVRREEVELVEATAGRGFPPAQEAAPVPPSETDSAAAPALPASSRLSEAECPDSTDPEGRATWRHRVGRQVVEALRFGLVPRFAIEALTVGLARERSLFAADLQRTRQAGAVRVLSAPYGAGKSHALDVLYSLALREGFAVGRVELDAFECQPNHPRNVYRRLVRSLRLPDAPGAQGLALLLDRAAASGAVTDNLARRRGGAWHEFLGPALVNWAALADDAGGRDWLLQWLSGEEVDLASMRARCARRTPKTALLALGSYTTLSSHYTYLLGGLACLLVRLGYPGLVLIFDEAEHLRLLSVEMAQRAIDFFKGLVHNALGSSLPSSYLDGCYHGGLKKFPFHWRLPAHLYVAMACTPEPGTDRSLAWLPERSLVTELSGHLARPELELLVQRLAAVHGWAFADSQAPPAPVRQRLVDCLVEALASGALTNLRQAVKSVVNALDLVRSLPGWSWDRASSEFEAFARTSPTSRS
jgi:hypothetical protein